MSLQISLMSRNYDLIQCLLQQIYSFKHPKPKKPASLKVYECHVGIGTSQPKVGTYKEFTLNVLPRIVKLGK